MAYNGDISNNGAGGAPWYPRHTGATWGTMCNNVIAAIPWNRQPGSEGHQRNDLESDQLANIKQGGSRQEKTQTALPDALEEATRLLELE